MVFTISIVILISIVVTSAAAALTSAFGLSWALGGTAQGLLAAVVFVFVKHPFDIGDRVDILVNGVVESLTVREISLMSCEFRRMDGKSLQAPNSLLNTVYIYNMRRSIAEGVPVLFRTIEQIEQLRSRMLSYVTDEKRDYVPNCITEVKEQQGREYIASTEGESCFDGKKRDFSTKSLFAIAVVNAAHVTFYTRKRCGVCTIRPYACVIINVSIQDIKMMFTKRVFNPVINILQGGLYLR